MEAICVKLDKGIVKEINTIAKEFHYSTRTDFIREAIRSKIEELQKKRALKNLEKYFGASKLKTTDNEHERIRDEVAKEYAKKFGVKLD
ncbi:MAG: ribbon-helix-helix domain-containing protein [Nanoarchaeota archaeon]|nr:ribbon-helix-helix domain-containing protein [Nanoarchaeota archaeon]